MRTWSPKGHFDIRDVIFNVAFYRHGSVLNAFYAPEMEFFFLRTWAKSVLLHIFANCLKKL